MTRQTTKITTKQIAGWLRRGLTAKDIGWKIVDQAMDEAKVSGERAEGIALRAWENATDYRLGSQAINLANLAAKRRKHLRGTFTVSGV